MKECDNSKIHTSSNFILSIYLLIMLDTLLLRPSPHCTTLRYTSPRFAHLPITPLHYTYRHFTSSHFHFTALSFGLTHLISYRSVSTHITKLDTVQFTHLQTYFQNNEHLQCLKSLSPLHLISLFFTYPINPSLYFAIHIYTSLLFTSPHWFSLS